MPYVLRINGKGMPFERLADAAFRLEKSARRAAQGGEWLGFSVECHGNGSEPCRIWGEAKPEAVVYHSSAGNHHRAERCMYLIRFCVYSAGASRHDGSGSD